VNKKFYLSRKFWAAIVTVACMITAFAVGGERGKELATLIGAVGSALIVGIGLEDQGKAAALLEDE